MIGNILIVLGMLIAGSIVFLFFLPLSQGFKKLSEIITFGLKEKLEDWMEPWEESGFCGAFGGRRGLVILGGSLGLAGITAIVLLLMGKTGEDLLGIFVENTIFGSMLGIMNSGINLLTASAVVSVGVSVYIGDLLALQFRETKWYIKLLIMPFLVAGTVALAVILRVPFGWLAIGGERVIAPLFQVWETQTFLNILRLIPAIIIGYVALVLILTTIAEYFATFAAAMMGLALVSVILLIPMLFGLEIPSTANDGVFVVIILAIEAFKAYMMDIYTCLSDKLPFLPEFDFDLD